MLPDFEVMHKQTRFFKSAPRRGIVSSLHRNEDVPVVDDLPPGSTRSAVTRVSQCLKPCS